MFVPLFVIEPKAIHRVAVQLYEWLLAIAKN